MTIIGFQSQDNLIHPFLVENSHSLRWGSGKESPSELNKNWYINGAKRELDLPEMSGRQRYCVLHYQL